MSTSTQQLDELFAQAGRATAAGSKSFFFATRFFPPALARSAHAVYWFCRHTDDLVDEAPSVEEGRAGLAHWTSALRQALNKGQSADPVLHLFVHTVAAYQIPYDLPFELIEGMRMDLDGIRYATFADLRVFCYRVASVVGLMMSHVIGFRDPALTYAIDLGIGMQLTNILRDIGEDWERGRLYLPAEDMERFGYSADELAAGAVNEPFRQLMRFQIERARGYYAASTPGIALLSEDGRFAVKIASDVYQDILHRIEQSNYDVFRRRAVVPPLRKLYLTGRNLAGPMARRGWSSLRGQRR